MIVQTPVIGIPNWDWKKDLVAAAERNPDIHLLPIMGFCYECSRHKRMLKFFDGMDNQPLEDNAYYQYQHKLGRTNQVIGRRIRKFKKLYKSIKNKGCQVAPIVTIDGCRLNGSHRLSILIHLGVSRSDINVVSYENHCSPKKSRKIREQVRKYRQEVYNF